MGSQSEKTFHERVDILEFIRNYGALIVVWMILFTMLGLPHFSFI
jgi:hypothetical protein